MFFKALPFALSFTFVPLIVLAALNGGWWIAAPFAWGWVCISLLDRVMGLNTENMDPATADELLIWHKRITWYWVPVQICMIVFCLWQATLPDHLGPWEAVGVMAGLGVATGGVGINFAHELAHQRNRWERWAADLLLVSVAYGHFATEHVYGHHITVATPKDPVTARKGENFFFFFVRAIFGSLISAWKIDAARQQRRGKPVWHASNPFWRYGFGAALFLAVAYGFGGGWGMALFGVQALMAIYQLEAVNYVEHYGLTREYIGNGKFERVHPHHSWNAAHTVSNWLFINLQRHSDHHFRPDRRFPLLQHYPWEKAPQLPFSYPIMIAIALSPPIWFWVMDKRVERWRKKFYPEISDWSAYDNGTIGREEPKPSGSVTA